MNIVLICVDQWRGDALGCEGHPIAMTPHLDQLAAEGTRFARAYAATPSCIPARASLYTGLSQTSTRKVGYRDGVPFDFPVTIASEFTKGGYQTQAIGKLHVFPERSQIGFQNVLLHDGYPKADYFDNGVNCNSQVARPWDKDEALHPSTWIVSEAQDFLRRRDTRKPFFLYLGFHRPHPPYDPPQWAFDQYLHDPMPDPPVGEWAAEVLGPLDDSWRADPSVAKLSPRALQRARAGYFGHISHIDLLLNRFLETLAEYGLRQDTVICFISDHGELLGDHHAFRKVLPYEGSARVPFLLQGPGIPARTVVTDAVAELRDVMPTLLDAAGLPVPEGLDGKSLLPVARGEQAQVREFLHGEHLCFGQSVHYLTDGREKYIWWSGTGREQRFDLVNDPQELHDLGSDLTWRARLIATLTDRPEKFVEKGMLITGKGVSALLP
jgi:arylsulfatase